MTTEQINELKTIKKQKGTLDAIKYVRDITGYPLRQCKDFVESLDAIQACGIQWVKCKDELPPQKFNDMGKTSDKVLIWGKDGWIQETIYSHTAEEWVSANLFPFEITHWAYINYPVSKP